MPTRKKKNATVVGVFETRARAEQAVADLKRAGFMDDQIGMVARNAEGEAVRTGGDGETYADEGAVAGAVAGAGAGALIGAGVLAGVIPVVGPILAVGALGTILLNAAGGAAVAGLVGALVGYGIPEEDAGYYESEVQAGKYLVTVEAGNRADEARAVLHKFGGFDRHGWSAVQAYRSAYETDTAARPAAAAATGAARLDADRTVQLKEEQLRANKEQVQAGEVEVRKEVHTEHRTVTVPVEREEVVIERKPVAGHAVSGTIDANATEIRIPVREEKVHVTKEAVVKEEVSVGKRKVKENKTVAADVRKEELVVETEGHAKVQHTDKRK